MAVVHKAELRPTKLELLAAWLPGRSWYQGPAAPAVERVTAYRFDDPAGKVGIETLIVRAEGGPLLQVPLTYREAPLPDGDAWLVGTTDHSVLGQRWVYDGCGDLAYVDMLTNTIFTGAAQAEEFVDVDGHGRLERREPSAFVRGSGSPTTTVPSVSGGFRVEDNTPTVIQHPSVELTVIRVLDETASDAVAKDAPDQFTLTGTWSGQTNPLLLAYAIAR